MRLHWFAMPAALLLIRTACGVVIYEVTSPYHHIRVKDEGEFRILCFDDALETRMSLKNPLQGHYEYTDYFHMAWLWNTQLNNVLMVGLGGGSAQSAFEHYYPGTTIETVEIDPVVLEVARTYFQFWPGERQKVQVADGRMFLRRSTRNYDLIVLDAYVQGRYGSSLPQHLATKEFFVIARDHLTTNGIVAYNVIGSLTGYRAEIVGAIYRTLNSVFPRVYLFPARTSRNIVMIATKTSVKMGMPALRQRALQLTRNRQVKVPGFLERLESFQPAAPPNAGRCPVLTDDYAPVEGLASP
jgi:spermidine synthase